MKSVFSVFLVTAILIFCIGCDRSSDGEEYKAASSTVNYPYMKAMWLSQYDLVDVYTENGQQRDRTDFIVKIEVILKKVVDIGVNTLIVQVRPFGDSFYPSEYYPLSSYAVGAYGNKASYDPFSIIVERAHALGISVHAWINPLRLMKDGEIGMIGEEYKIKQWYDRDVGDIISSVSGRLYLNPAYCEVRNLICNGVREIIELYPVDGIHIDDYFYPTTEESFDSTAYRRYVNGGGTMDLADFRRDQINSLVREIYSTVKSSDENILFGVSPSGVMSNNYNLLYADVAKWCSEEGYLDYLCPQIYFGFEHSSCAFDKVCDEFSDIVKKGNVRLIVGLSLGKAESEYDPYAGEGKYEWRDNKDILRRSYLYAKATANCSGICLFSYRLFYDPLSGNEVEETLAERQGLVPLLLSEK